MRAVLTYHSIDPSGSPISVSREAFHRQLDWLAAESVTVVPLDRLVALPPQADAVALTFDDGFANFADHAFPLLAERGLPATVFVVSDHAGGTNDWGGRPAPGIPTLPLLDWPALGRLAERGIALGCHTRTHPRLTTLGQAALVDEIHGSGDRIERETGVRPEWFAYPYGDLDDRVAEEVAKRYRIAVTTEHRGLRAAVDPARVGRIDMFYFRDRLQLPRWNGAGMRRGIWLRRQARRARRLFPAAGGVG